MNKDQDGYDEYGNYEEYEDAYPDEAYAAGAVGEAEPVDGPEESGDGNGIPLRGLAMVLVAVAILLAIWGIWSLVGGGDDADKEGDAAASTQASAPATQASAPNSQLGQQGQPGQQPAVTGAPQQASSEQNPAAGAPEANRPAAPTGAAEAQNPNAAPGVQGDPRSGQARGEEGANAERGTEVNGANGANNAAPGTQAPAGRVNVLNNSTVQDLAANTSRQLEGQGNQIGEVGNLPEEQYKVNETTVFYQPGSEERARKLAEQLGGVARPYDPNLPATTAGQGDLTVVLAGAVAAPTR